MASTTTIDAITILSSILAGGCAGQLFMIFGGNKITAKIEHDKWLKIEKHKLFSELLTLVTRTPKTPEGLNNWTYEIRDISQRVHILFSSGTAPEELSAAIETVFKLAQAKKDGKDAANWKEQMRDAIRILRKEMSKSMQA